MILLPLLACADDRADFHEATPLDVAGFAYTFTEGLLYTQETLLGSGAYSSSLYGCPEASLEDDTLLVTGGGCIANETTTWEGRALAENVDDLTFGTTADPAYPSEWRFQEFGDAGESDGVPWRFVVDGTVTMSVENESGVRPVSFDTRFQTERGTYQFALDVQTSVADDGTFYWIILEGSTATWPGLGDFDVEVETWVMPTGARFGYIKLSGKSVLELDFGSYDDDLCHDVDIDGEPVRGWCGTDPLDL